MSETRRISVLLEASLAERFEDFCKENSHKKSTFGAHLIREFLKKEGYPEQKRLL
jgi:metal-responsive CopG/Arc/MetJ family transcriptional regulator